MVRSDAKLDKYTFVPARVYFEPGALEYELGRQLKRRFDKEGVPVLMTTSHNQVRGIPGNTPKRAYWEAKRTLVVGTRRSRDFQTSKPSAEYALPLVTGCPGFCEYCYLQTTLGPKPYVRIYVNFDDIFGRADEYIQERAPALTRFEGSCTSDPIPVEPYGGGLTRAIEFFARKQHGRFRFVTKYRDVDNLLSLDHRGHTEVRFSLNSRYVAETFEPGVPPVADRIEASRRIADAGYPYGYLIAPVILHPNWKQEYGDLLKEVWDVLGPDSRPTFEVISHRYTKPAKRLIMERYPCTKLPMVDEERTWKWGQFGYGKYVYTREKLAELEAFFRENIGRRFPQAEVKYVI